jgi:ethanolamine utilization protein EutA
VCSSDLLPVISPRLEDLQRAEAELPPALAEAMKRWDLGPESSPFAISLPIENILDYDSLEGLANALAEFARLLPRGRPLVVIIKQDYAQALGQTLKALDGERPLLVIDQVGIEEGDYIDIGLPLMDGRVVPLVVKTLIFYH